MIVDGFVDIEPVGSGGLGDVYRATRESTGTVVAIKELRADGSAEARTRRAQRELTALASLRGHPNVINLEEVVSPAPGQLLLVMEFSPAGSLEERAVAFDGMLPLAEVLLVAEHAATALTAAHDVGIVHRDIKPANLLIGSFGQVKVCDFGISSISASADFAEKTNAVSYRFASPEELRGDAEVSARTDVYSLAVALSKLLTNRYFNHETAVHLTDPDATPGRPHDEGLTPERASALAAVDADFRAMLARCLKHRPQARPTAAELLAAVSSLSARLGDARLQRLEFVAPPERTALPITPRNTGPTARPRARSTAMLWGAAVLLWIGVAILAVIYLTGEDSAGSGHPASSVGPQPVDVDVVAARLG